MRYDGSLNIIYNTYRLYFDLTFSAEPKYLSVTLPDGQDVIDDSSDVSSIGPFNEGQEVRLLCEAGGGKPIAKVIWYNGTQVISGQF